MACPILATFLFTISFSAFFYSLDVFSHCHRLFKQYKIKCIWSPRGIEPRTACITHKRSATELRQPASKQTLQFCIYPAKSHSQQINENSLFSKILIIRWTFLLHLYYFTISFSAFFYSLDVFSHCHRLFKQYEIKNIWSPPGARLERLCVKQLVLGSIPGGDQIFLICTVKKKPCESERIHLTSSYLMELKKARCCRTIV